MGEGLQVRGGTGGMGLKVREVDTGLDAYS